MRSVKSKDLDKLFLLTYIIIQMDFEFSFYFYTTCQTDKSKEEKIKNKIKGPTIEKEGTLNADL